MFQKSGSCTFLKSRFLVSLEKWNLLKLALQARPKKTKCRTKMDISSLGADSRSQHAPHNSIRMLAYALGRHRPSVLHWRITVVLQTTTDSHWKRFLLSLGDFCLFQIKYAWVSPGSTGSKSLEVVTGHPNLPP